MNIESLEEQIKVVAEARGIAVIAKLKVNKSRQGWESQNAPIIDIADRAVELTQEEEAKLRELTLQAYAETGNKHPAKGVDINITTTYEYDPADALKWAIEHEMALKLDETKFKKHVKADPPDFVTVDTNVPKATIATNLEE